MIDLSDKIRAYFDEINPPFTADELMREPATSVPGPRRRVVVGRGPAVAVAAAIVVILGIGLPLLLFLRSDGTDPGSEPSVTMLQPLATTIVEATQTPTTALVITPSPPELLTVDAIEASSSLGLQWGARNLIDGDLDTEWQDRSLKGEGAVLFAVFSTPVYIDHLLIYNLPDEWFARNYKVRGVELLVDTDDNPVVAWQLPNTNNEPHKVPLGVEVQSVIHIRVTSTYDAEPFDGGIPFNELAVAEIEFYGHTISEDDLPEQPIDVGPAPATTQAQLGPNSTQPDPGQPVGPVVEIATGVVEGTDDSWRLTGFMNAYNDACVLLNGDGVFCGRIPEPPEYPMSVSVMVMRFTPEPRMTCMVGNIATRVASVVVTFDDDSIQTPAVYLADILPLNLFAYCWAGDLEEASADLFDIEGTLVVSRSLGR